MPIENTPRKRLATSGVAVRTFSTSGGNWMIMTDPIVQKKLMAMIAR